MLIKTVALSDFNVGDAFTDESGDTYTILDDKPIVGAYIKRGRLYTVKRLRDGVVREISDSIEFRIRV